MIFDRHVSLKYVDTAGKNTKIIQEYIQNQLKQDQLSEQLTFDTIDPFKG